MKRVRPCFLVLSLMLFLGPAIAADRPPNIILIVADDLGYGDLGSYGAQGYSTPHLDALAKNGVRFTHFAVAQAVCSASRAAFLTGCYPNRLGIHGALSPKALHGLNPQETTLAKLLRTQGYVTGMAGKWHLGAGPEFSPLQQGFEQWLGIPYSNDMWPHHPEAPPGTYPPLPLIENDRVVDAALSPEDQIQLTTRFTEAAVSFITEQQKRPFFFYLAHPMPHVPLFVSEKFRGKSARGLYGDVIMELDWSVGEIVKTVKALGLERDTLIIFTSDNGPWLSYGTHAGSSGIFREGKGTSWEGGLRVPCIMAWPGTLPKGVVNDRFFMSIDLLPTIATRLGAPLPAQPIDGRDVWPLLLNTPETRNPHEAYGIWYAQNELQAVISGDGRWKLVLPHTYRTLGGKPGGDRGKPVKYTNIQMDHPQLFDLRQDPAETTSLTASQPQVVQELTGLADAFRQDLGDSLTQIKGRGNRLPGRKAAPPPP